MGPVSNPNSVFGQDADKWMFQPKNTQVNAPAPFDLDPSKGTRKTKEAKEASSKKAKARDPRFPQLRHLDDEE